MKDEETYELNIMNNDKIKNMKSCKLNIFERLFSKNRIVETTRTININNNFDNSEFISNEISTAKYSWYTWVPKFLFEQFSNYANIFFLAISIIQQIPGLSPTSRYTTIIPLIIVLLSTAIKEFIEDLKRHTSDKETNNRKVKILEQDKFEDKKWLDVKVGDIVRIENGEDFPSDLFLISSSEPEGVCYIETSNLDGETNLKVKQSLSETNEIITPQLAYNIKGSIQSEGPNDSLYTYTGTLHLNDLPISISPNQILLRGAMLRNTNWIYGIVIFTGHDSKLMRNANSAPIKRTNIVKKTNTQILFLFIILLVLAAISASGSLYSQSTNSNLLNFIGLKNLGGSGFYLWIKSFFTFIILYNNLIPISLIVTMEVVKYKQADLINSDLDMYYEPSDTPALCRTSSLVEELGQIGYIFSDKTGTLTCNKMDFKECTIQGVQYTEDLSSRNKFTFDKLKEKSNEDLSELNYVNEFLTLLATCHTVIPEINENEIIYQASSPDEGALVKGASQLGYKFYMRKPKSIIIKIERPSGTIEEQWEILNICEFNSTRKRMSTVLRAPNGKIKLYCKGADNVILERLNDQNKFVDTTLEHLDEYANIGLRTLCLAYKDIEEDEYIEWNKKFNEANTSLDGRQDKLDEVAELIEKDLHLLGATAIEDKLQDGVPDAIYTLGQAGIKVWILTGDKQETAINIGHSCKLIQSNMITWIFNKNSFDECNQYLLQKNAEINDLKDDVILIIDGKTLEYCLNKNLDEHLFNLSSRCKSVICCRVSPLQKALIVKMVKKRTSQILLAIGDGANDVSMIQAAHVGVGINGQEGLQAARSSDFAISQFRYLKKLLLIHGAWSYNRLSKLILFSFYKNITLYLTQFWYSFLSGFSGQTLYESWTNTLYNVLFTMMPPLMIGVFDQHLSARMLDRYPELYKVGQNDLLFNSKTFWGSTLNALYHSIIIFILVTLIYYNDILLPNGLTGNYAHFSITIYSCVLITVLLKSLLITSHWTKYTIYAIPGSLIIWFAYIPIYTNISIYLDTGYDYNGSFYILFSSPIFWLILFVIPILCLLRDYSWKFYCRLTNPETYHTVQEIQKFNIPDYRPSRERFRKALQKASTIQKIKRERGYAFSQNELGLANLMSYYDTSKPKPQG